MVFNIILLLICVLVAYALGLLGKASEHESMIAFYADMLNLKDVEIGRLEREIHDLKQTKNS